MNKIVNKFLLAGDKFKLELHLRQPGFTYISLETLIKHCERIQKFKEARNLKHIYKNELDKACFTQDAAYPDSKDLPKRTISDKILKDKSYEIAMKSKYSGYRRRLARMAYKFFNKKTRLRKKRKKNIKFKVSPQELLQNKKSLC